MKLSTQEVAARIAHCLDQDDLPAAFRQMIAKCASDELGPGFNGRFPEDDGHRVVRRVKKAIFDFRAVAKANATSWGTDGGPTDLPTSDGEYRIFWEAPVPETVTIAIEELVRMMTDRGTSVADALATARSVVADFQPPTDVTKMSIYLDRATRRALERDPRERTVKRLSGGF